MSNKSEPGLSGHVKYYMSARSGDTAQIGIARGMPQRYMPVLCARFPDMISTFFLPEINSQGKLNAGRKKIRGNVPYGSPIISQKNRENTCKITCQNFMTQKQLRKNK